ncbi:hypothetical protein F511_34363 [Dorcoceras hygrometricum]|uniref:Uncharacterized protein n=1 Tax=Dorcoceras hygrometricum TaxID=472368 RepID=A0A2Z7AKA6_9LAMI|nr:hypothetical protein F511_34363 [Dorcoceras hygrometricum]
MQMDSDLVIYRTTLVRTFQVVTICLVDKSEVLVVLIVLTTRNVIETLHDRRLTLTRLPTHLGSLGGGIGLIDNKHNDSVGNHDSVKDSQARHISQSTNNSGHYTYEGKPSTTPHGDTSFTTESRDHGTITSFTRFSKKAGSICYDSMQYQQTHETKYNKYMQSAREHCDVLSMQMDGFPGELSSYPRSDSPSGYHMSSGEFERDPDLPLRQQWYQSFGSDLSIHLILPELHQLSFFFKKKIPAARRRATAARPLRTPRINHGGVTARRAQRPTGCARRACATGPQPPAAPCMHIAHGGACTVRTAVRTPPPYLRELVAQVDAPTCAHVAHRGAHSVQHTCGRRAHTRRPTYASWSRRLPPPVRTRCAPGTRTACSTRAARVRAAAHRAAVPRRRCGVGFEFYDFSGLSREARVVFGPILAIGPFWFDQN